MGFEYKDDRMARRQVLESGHKSVFYATEEVDLVGDVFNAAVAIVTGAVNVDDAIKALKNAGKGAEMLVWLAQQNGSLDVSAGTVRYTFWVRYRNGPIRTGWQVKGYKIQGWVAVD